ncbi:Aminopeptidase N, partial [Orchesella cincta]
ASATNNITSEDHDPEQEIWENLFGKRSERFIPSHYDLELRPIFEEEGKRHTMPGKVLIIGTTMEKTNKIRLDPSSTFSFEQNPEHPLEIKSSSIKVTSNGAPVTIKNVDAKGFYIDLDRKVGAGETIEVYIEYVAKIQQKEFSKGFMHLPCGKDCKEAEIAVTGFNAYAWVVETHCGHIFPCLDNRDYKTTFNLSLIRKNEYQSAANGLLLTTTPHSQLKGWMTDKYTWNTKIRMPLFAFTVFKGYSYEQSYFGKEKKIVKVFAPKEDINKAVNVINVTATAAAKILSFYEEYFGSSSNVQKIELFFVSTSYRDFGTSFMKTMGMNFYNLDDLIPKNEADQSTKLRVIESVVGSLAHQWVGEWWDPEPETSLVFTKALPRFLEYLGLQQIDTALADAAIYKDILEAEAVDRDDENYQSHKDNWSKGTLLLRMMEEVLSKDVLKAGLQTYFNRLWSENGTRVTTEEFYEILQKSTGKGKLPFDIATILGSFVHNVGVPLVRVGIANETHFVFKQERFRYVDSRNKTNDAVWYLPVTYTQGNERKTIWLTPDQNVKYVPGNTSELLLLNPDATGYYRTLYEDSSLLQRLQQQLELNHTEINPLTRAGLLSDFFVFADEKYSSYGAALNLTSYFNEGSANETSLVVWTAFITKFTGTYNKFISHSQYAKMKNFLLEKVNRILEDTNPPKENEQIALRDYLLGVACTLNHPYCETKAKKLFLEWRANSNGASPLDYLYPDSRPILQCAIVANGGQEAYDFLLAKYREAIKAKVSTEEARALVKSLACAPDKPVFQKLLELLLTPPSSGGIEEYNRWFIEDYVLKTPLPNGKEIILPFISKNFDLIDEKLGHRPGESVIPWKIRALTRSWHFSSAEKKKEIQELLKLHEKKFQDEGNLIHVPTLYQELDANIQWMDTHGHDILNSI